MKHLQLALRTLAPLLLLALASPGCSGPAKQVQKIDRALVDSDLAMAWTDSANRSDSSFSESLIARGELEGGGSFYLRLLVSNIAGADGRAELKAGIALGDGPSLHGRLRRARGDWSHGQGRFDVTVGESRVVVGLGRAEITLRYPEFEADLVIESPLPALRPAGGMADFGQERFYLTTVLIPRGRLSGEIRLPGGESPPVAIAGPAYAEHRASNLAPHSMARAWFNLIEIGPEHTVLSSSFQRTEQLGGRTQGWAYWADDQRIVGYEPSLTVIAQKTRRDDETGYEVPMVALLKSVEGDAFTGVVKATDFEQRIDDLSGLSKVERFVVERLMKPFTFRYRSEILLKARAGAGPEEVLRGEARYQYQQLN